MIKCPYCNSETVELEVLNACNVDFIEKNINTKKGLRVLNTFSSNKKIIQGEIIESYLCKNCNKIIINLKQI